MIIPIGQYVKVKRRNSLRKIYYKFVLIFDSDFFRFKEENKNE